ncbi:hypothetical protein GQ55_1G155900 [Panicum hallii var. hallii]|uniref:Uncharacterized protein n=1 Tax=Panicum hallii var. hallii TaxID=1504633 RepID=A0A2T7F5I2_9POAL|nr:hypothetical protein GQ55_1G155900 [Panicum hallii var. hallii]
MAAPSNVSWDHAGHLHTNALHWEGFPRLLWESLSLFHYTEPPQYDGVEYRAEVVPRCRVRMTIPQHPFRSQWRPMKVDVVGYRIIDTIETAALEAIHIFCKQHPMKVAGYPIGLFPAIDSSDPEWNFRIGHYGHLLGDLAEETIRSITRFMNVQHHYQILLRRSMGQLTGVAQGHYRNADRQVNQIVELQALITQKDEIIAARDETIHHREDQINETPEEEEDPEEVEGVSGIDSEHGDPILSPYHSSSGIQSSVGNFDDF